MAWLILFIAGLLELAWATGLKYSHGFTKLGPSIFTLVTMAGSVFLLAHAMKYLPMGTAYAVWTGIGAVGAAIVGIVVFKEPTSAIRIISISFIILGLIGLKISSPV